MNESCVCGRVAVWPGGRAAADCPSPDSWQPGQALQGLSSHVSQNMPDTRHKTQDLQHERQDVRHKSRYEKHQTPKTARLSTEDTRQTLLNTR